MALLRLFRSEAFRLVAMGFLIGSAGIMLTQPSQAQDPAAHAAAVTSPAP